MGLPKNFTEVNQENRQKALDNLKWFIFYYDYELTDEYATFVNEGYSKWNLIVDELGSHRVFASTETSAIEMFHMYMKTVYMDTGKLEDYKLKFKGCEEGVCGITTILE
jgi:hypothetical protein